MKGDQVIRAVAAVCVVALYLGYVGLNGHGPVAVPLLGDQSPFGVAIGAELVLAFPELLDRLPFGPTRKK